MVRTCILPTVFQDFVFPFLEDGFAWIEGLFILADPSGIELLEGSFENILTALSSGIISLSNAALSAAGAATKIPGVFMRTVITVIATVFLTIDFDKVSGFLLRQITEKQKAIMQEAKGYFGGALLKCIDYSAMPFNLGGRINLLYCFFWGIAAVVWIKGIYPKAAWLIDIILKKTGWILTGILVVFMAFNVFVSVLALVRYDTRADEKAAVYRWEQAMDEHFDDAKMERIYPNAIRQ